MMGKIYKMNEIKEDLIISDKAKDDKRHIDEVEKSDSESDSISVKKQRQENYQELSEKVDYWEALLRQNKAFDRTDSFDRPLTTRHTLDLGGLKTDIDEKKFIRPAEKEKLLMLNKLQGFNSLNWKEVRYSNALKTFAAKPGFKDLKINDELCYLDKGKDHLLSTERVMAGLTNAILDQREWLEFKTQTQNHQVTSLNLKVRKKNILSPHLPIPFVKDRT